MSRERKVRVVNEGKTKKARHCMIDPKTNSVKQRLEEFPQQSFIKVGEELHCEACKCSVSTKKASMKQHCSNAKHISNLKKLHRGREEQVSLRSFVEDQRSSIDGRVAGTTLDPSVAVHRLIVAHALLLDGLPFTSRDQIDGRTRQLLEFASKART